MITLYPAKQFVTPATRCAAMTTIREELDERIIFFEKHGQLLEAQRMKMRTEYDLGDDAGDGLLQRHRKLLAHLSGPSAGLAAVHAARFFPADFLLVSTNRTRRSRRSAACTRATSRARRCS
jgi:excinuclease ABC subunit B